MKPFAVVPTPDDGERLSDTPPWDEAARPTGPAPDPSATYSDEQQATAQHLIDVHDHFRGEMAQLRRMVAQLGRGEVDPGAVRGFINRMTIRQNNWTLGVYCAAYCRNVTGHHTREDTAMFPHLRRADPALNPVIDRLHEEHEVIAALLEEVDRVLTGFVAGDALAPLRDVLDRLSDAMRSHLSYEERELVEPLARHGFV